MRYRRYRRLSSKLQSLVALPNSQELHFFLKKKRGPIASADPPDMSESHGQERGCGVFLGFLCYCPRKISVDFTHQCDVTSRTREFFSLLVGLKITSLSRVYDLQDLHEIQQPTRPDSVQLKFSLNLV